MKERIELNDTIPTIIVKMSGGNPGAATCMIEMIKQGGKIDPQSFAGGLGAILSLDTLKIYEHRIWMLYKDVCKQNMETMLAVLRGHQLGFLRDIQIQHAIDFRGEGIDLADITSKVKAQLPQFGQPETVAVTG